MRPVEYKTKVGSQILSFLEQKKNSAVSVTDICENLKEQDVAVNISTVYRQLEKLVASKKVIAHSSDSGKKIVYQYIAGEKTCLSHLHIQCTKCAKIIHLDCSESDEFISHIAHSHGVIVDYEKTVLYGLCEQCSKAEHTLKQGAEGK